MSGWSQYLGKPSHRWPICKPCTCLCMLNLILICTDTLPKWCWGLYRRQCNVVLWQCPRPAITKSSALLWVSMFSSASLHRSLSKDTWEVILHHSTDNPLLWKLVSCFPCSEILALRADIMHPSHSRRVHAFTGKSDVLSKVPCLEKRTVPFTNTLTPFWTLSTKWELSTLIGTLSVVNRTVY